MTGKLFNFLSEGGAQGSAYTQQAVAQATYGSNGASSSFADLSLSNGEAALVGIVGFAAVTLFTGGVVMGVRGLLKNLK